MSRQTALLVIDVQESFRQRPYFSDDELPSFFDRCKALVDGFTAAGLPVVRILHVEGDGPFSKASGFVETMHELAFEPAATFEKNVHSALVGTGLQGWLTSRGISRLVIAGIRTEQCCETTTRNASDLGFEVDYVTEATLTFPLTTRAGRKVSAAEIRERTELVLSDRFATIVTADEAVARATAALAH
jgi:nicotinamidase-related amidase